MIPSPPPDQEQSNVHRMPSPLDKGMLVHVLRSAIDTTSYGITRRFDSFVAVGDMVPRHAQIFEATEQIPALRICERVSFGTRYIWAEPLDPVPAGLTGYMAGGNYIVTTDGRWADIVGDTRPIEVHDRTEAPLMQGGI